LTRIKVRPTVALQNSDMSEAELIARYDGRAPRYTSYPTAPHFSATVGSQTYAQWLGELDRQTPLSLYLHVPFCDRLCFYCGCNTSVVRLESSLRDYASLLEREIALVAAFIGHRARVSHVHWGGGTPTSLPADCLVSVMDLLRSLFEFDTDAEVAIEIDPTSVPPDRREALRQMGVTRMSLGVQDLDNRVQEAIGRRQSYEQTEECALMGRSLGIHSLNLDLIYGLPLQTEASVVETARQALKLGADRAAVFGYAHVPWMKKHQSLIDPSSLPNAVARFRQQQAIHAVLTQEGGYLPIGLDHYARPGDAMSQALALRGLRRGFQGYTTDTAPVLVGFGASAIGSLSPGYVQNASSAVAYGRSIRSGGLATVRGAALKPDDRLRREVIERLMCDLEVDIEELAAAHLADPAPLRRQAEGIARFQRDGLATWDGRRIEVTEKGRPFLRSLAALFDAYLQQDEQQPKHSQTI
jgi:oxygen-independent coproporphyrinogen III oxidase